MKIHTETNRIHSTLQQSSDFGINTEDMSHIIHLLRSRIYSNKILAVLREYLTNAIDAHVEADIPHTPILLTLPTLSSPVLKIRDYGAGLSETDVRELYIKYGASTKRSSNSYTGCLGIGCKAAFAYSDTFIVTTWYNGTKSCWTALIDDNNNGSISCTHSSPNMDGHQDGVEISIAIEPRDIDTFESEAKKLLPYFDIMPECNIEISPLDISEEGTGWQLKRSTEDQQRSYWNRHGGKAIAVMGNIPYKIEEDKMGSLTDDSVTKLLSCDNLIMAFPLGALDIAANRESLEYTKRTIDNLCIQASKVAKDISKRISNATQEASTFWNACTYAINSVQSLPNDIQASVLERITYKGTGIKRTITLPNSVDVHYRKHFYSKDEYRNAKDNASAIKIEPNIHICTYNADEITAVSATRRIRTLQDQTNYKIEDKYYAIPRTYDNEDWMNRNVIPSKYFEGQVTKKDGRDHSSKLHLIADSLIDLSEIEPLKSIRKVAQDSDDGVKYVKIDVCEIIASRTAPGRIKAIAETVPTTDDERVYIPIDRFSWHNPPSTGASLEQDQMARFFEANKLMMNDLTEHKELSIAPRPFMHGVKKHHLKKLNDTWITYDKWYAREYKRFCNKHRKAMRLTALASANATDRWPNDYHLDPVCTKLGKASDVPWNKKFKFLQDIKDYEDVQHRCQPEPDAGDSQLHPYHYHRIHWVARALGIVDSEHESDNDRYQTQEAILERWPMLEWVDSNYSCNESKLYNDIKHYIQITA
jgi:hypothetical protein